MEYDLGNLLAYDPSPIDPSLFKKNVETACQTLATQIAQALAHQLFELPSEAASVGRLVHLPAPTTALPREKPIPKPKPPTKWEVFAARKGIQKQKRSKLVWDEATDSWKRRWGYDKANDDDAVPVIEADPQDALGEDPFSKAKTEKKQRTARQTTQQLANLKVAAKQGGKAALPSTIKLAASLPEHGKGRPVKRKDLRGELKSASRQAAISTASVGKFDKVVAHEDPKKIRKIAGQRTKKLAVETTGEERTRASGVIDHILRKNADDIVDIGRAIGLHEASARTERHMLKNKGFNKKGKYTKRQQNK